MYLGRTHTVSTIGPSVCLNWAGSGPGPAARWGSSSVLPIPCPMSGFITSVSIDPAGGPAPLFDITGAVGGPILGLPATGPITPVPVAFGDLLSCVQGAGAVGASITILIEP